MLDYYSKCRFFKNTWHDIVLEIDWLTNFLIYFRENFTNAEIRHSLDKEKIITHFELRFLIEEASKKITTALAEKYLYDIVLPKWREKRNKKAKEMETGTC